MTKQTFLDISTRGDITVATVQSADLLEAINVDAFGKEIIAYLEANPGLNLVLDFGKVDYLSSAVLTELLRAHKTLSKSGGKVRLCSLKPKIREVFEITNLDKVFPINDDVDTAVAHFERALRVTQDDSQWDKL